MSRAERATLLALLCAAGCSSEPVVLDRSLSPGDRVVIIGPADDPEAARATLFVVGDDGRVVLGHPPDERVAVAVLPPEAFAGVTGDAAPWGELAVRMDGDDGPCGCRGVALDGPTVVGPGDHCALPAAIPLELVPSRPEDEPRRMALRDRLRLVWPGACDCAPSALGGDVSVDVCPIGEGAERQRPDQLVVADDGTVLAISRGLVRTYPPGGAAVEHALEPALQVPWWAQATSGGDVLLGARRIGGLASKGFELRYLRARGAAAPLALDVDLPTLAVEGMRWDEARERLWLYGRAGNDLSRRAGYARCIVDAATSAVHCEERLLPLGTSCPHYANDVYAPAITAWTALPGGDAAGLGSAGDVVLFSAARDEAVCAPRAEPISLRGVDGAELRLSAQALESLGDRLVACGVTVEAGMLNVGVVTATIGAIGEAAVVRWTPVVERRGGLAQCLPPFRDPARPGALFFPIRWGVEGEFAIAEVHASGTSTVHASALDLYPAAGAASLLIAGRGAHLAARTPSGEVLSLDGGGARPLASLEGLGGAARVDVRGLLALGSGGFDVDLGGRAPLHVDVGARVGCDAIARTIPAGALDARAVDAVGTLGPDLLRAVHDETSGYLEWSGDPTARLPLAAPVVRIGELVPGRWAVMLDQRGVLVMSNGHTVQRLADGDWRELGVAGGVAWVASPDRLARVTMGAGDVLRVESVLNRVDRGKLDAVHAPAGFRITSLTARCGGGALFAARRDPYERDGDLSAWVVEPRGDHLELRRYFGIGEADALRGLGGQFVIGFGGPGAAPVAVFGLDFWENSAVLIAPGALLGALPFANPTAVVSAGSDLLVGGPFGRLALVRVR